MPTKVLDSWYQHHTQVVTQAGYPIPASTYQTGYPGHLKPSTSHPGELVGGFFKYTGITLNPDESTTNMLFLREHTIVST